MSHETDAQQPQIQLEELARPEETLSAEQAGEVQGGFSAPNTGFAAPPERPNTGLAAPPERPTTGFAAPPERPN